MDRASEKVPAGALVAAVLLAAAVVVPHSAPRASTSTDAMGLFTPGLVCGPAETLVGTGAAGLLARVRADAAEVPPHRPETAAKARTAKRPGAREAARPLAVAPRSARKATPQTEHEPRPVVLRSFYTCNAASTRSPAEGTGWRLVGPLRQS